MVPQRCSTLQQPQPGDGLHGDDRGGIAMCTQRAAQQRHALQGRGHRKEPRHQQQEARARHQSRAKDSRSREGRARSSESSSVLLLDDIPGTPSR